MKIALVSYNSRWLNPIENIDNCIGLLAAAHEQSCELVVFPEMALTGFSPQEGCIEPSVFNLCLETFKEYSHKYNLHIIFGALSRFSSGHDSLPTNDAFLVSPSQRLVETYSKIHLFSFGDEHHFVCPGSELSVFSIAGINFGPSICYDLRFPEMYSLLANKVNCFINIASWPSARISHWYTLLRARAIENQAYVIGVNRSGEDGNGLLYDFSSSVYDPIGNQVSLTNISGCDCMSYVDIDFSFLHEVRSRFNFLHDKRHDLYKLFISAP